MTACRICGCTDEDCRRCIARTGSPCCWVEPDLCSACAPSLELRHNLHLKVLRGDCTQAEADEAFRFFDSLSDKELRGEVTLAEALRQIEEFARQQIRRRPAS